MTKYYYIDDISKQQCGPYIANELLTKNIRQETMVWCSGMKDWAKAGSIEQLSFLFGSKTSIPEQQRQNNQAKVEYQQTNQNHPSGNKWDGILPMPKNWLLESILLSIFCCSPISVVGIFHASKVEALYYAKDYDGALRASNNAKKWALIGMMFLPVCYLIFIFFLAIVATIYG